MKTVYFITSYAGGILHPDKFHEKCYGSEFALVEVASRLTKDYNVYVFSSTPHGYKSDKLNINWRSEHDFDHVLKETGDPEYIVVSRYINVFFTYNLPESSKIFVWLHDLVPHMQIENKMLPIACMGSVIPRVHKWVPVGTQMIYEKSMNGNVYLDKYGIKPAMCYVIKNGITVEDGWDPVDLPLGIEKVKNSFIYSSWTAKGLWNLLDHWGDVLKIMPDATLNVYYEHSEQDSKRFQEYKKKYDSIKHHGRVEQKQLFEAMKKSEYWLFPNEYPETCCTTAMEMGYYGVIQITNSRGELKNNVAGNMINHDAPDDTFWRTALDVLETAKDDEHLKELMRKKQFEWCKKQTWDQRVERWKNLFEKV